MTPYYVDDAVTIYHGDCLQVLHELHDVDMVLTSPPYNLNGDGHLSGGSNKEWARLADGYLSHDDAMPHVEYVAWQHQVLRACWETLSHDGAIFYNHKPRIRGNEVLLPLELNPGLPLRQIITWDRGSGFCRNLTHFVPSYEWVLLLARPAFRLTTRSVDDVWRIPFETGSEHPAPFPLAFASRAIAATAARIILDPYMGSGTTLRAAKTLGRKAIGIDENERYCEIAAQRMAQEVLAL